MAVLLCAPLMPYKELTIDGVLGRVLLVHTESGMVHPWRVLRYEPGPEGEEDRGHLVCCQTNNAASQLPFPWPTTQGMIASGHIIVE